MNDVQLGRVSHSPRVNEILWQEIRYTMDMAKLETQIVIYMQGTGRAETNDVKKDIYMMKMHVCAN